MALRNVIAKNQNRDAALREQAKDNLFRKEKAFRAKESIKAWSDVAGIGDKLQEMDFRTAANTAFNLNQEAQFLSQLSEGQRSSAFAPFTPDNMLKLIVLSFPESSRNKVFLSVGMESAKDSIKVVRPVASKGDAGLTNDDKAALYSSLEDPFGINAGTDYANNIDVNSLDDYRKALYETTEARLSSDLINAPYAETADGTITFVFAPIADGTTGLKAGGGTGARDITAKDIALSKKWANHGFERGYTFVYGKSENDPIAFESKRTGVFAIAAKYKDAVSEVTISSKEVDGVTYPTVVVKADATKLAELTDVVSCFGRCNTEDDREGQTMPNVELVMTDYTLKPRETALGVSWTNLTQIVMDSSFGLSTKDMMLRAAADAVRSNLDYRAFKLAYTRAEMLPEAFHVEFDAGYKGTENAVDGLYTYNAQTITTAIETLGDTMHNALLRGGVSKLVAGNSAATYMTLSKDFDFTGKEAAEGVYRYGQLAKMPVFKAPSSIIPTNKILCIYQNEKNPADAALVLATLVPFWSSGAIQRKNLYQEASVASYGDVQIMNPYYMGIIEIKNLKEVTKN